jgi:hypothetical protein
MASLSTVGAALALALALAIVPVAGCISVRYQARQSTPGDPATPATHAERITVRDLHFRAGEVYETNGPIGRPRVTREGLTADAVPDETDRTLLLSVRIDAGPGADVVGMSWSPASAPRCAGGHPALAIMTDVEGELNSSFAHREQVRWERPVILRGQNVLSGRFDEDRPLLHDDSVVDVLLVERDGAAARWVCARVPVTGAGVTYWNQKRWSLGSRLSWQRGLRFSRGSVLLAGLSVARWWGPVRIGVEGIIGGTSDAPSGDGTPDPQGPAGTAFCFLVSGPDCDDVTTGGAALQAGGIGWRWERWALGWSVAYEALYARIRPVARHGMSAGPRVSLQLLHALPDIAGVSRHSPTSAWGFELYAAAAQEVSGPAAGTPVTYGISLLGF